MISVKARAAKFLIRGIRSAFNSENMDLRDMRKGFELVMDRFSLPSGVQVVRESVAGVRGASFFPEILEPTHCILFLHGGAYAMGSIKTHATLAAQLAKTTQAKVFMPSYPLAPEHPFPYALNLLSDWLPKWEQVHRLPFFLAGDSAGGGLALALHHKCTARNTEAGKGLILFSPWVDLRPLGPDVQELEHRDAYIRCADVERFSQLYAADQRAHPDASPLLQASAPKCPVLLHYTTDELLYVQCKALGQKFRNQGVELQERVWPGLFHAFQALGNWLPESQDSIEEAGVFVQKIVRMQDLK
jgi:monoterpene epsilon-lactone hydrolase